MDPNGLIKHSQISEFYFNYDALLVSGSVIDISTRKRFNYKDCFRFHGRICELARMSALS